MIHNRSMKMLGNLALLLVLFTSQVAAAPNRAVINEDSSALDQSTFSSGKLSSVSTHPKLNVQSAPGDTTRISDAAGGSRPSVSKTGAYMAFESAGNVYYREMRTNTNILIGPGSRPSISGNGLHVAYESSGHIYVYDRYPGVSTQIEFGSTPSLSESGQYVAYELSGSILVHDISTNIIHIAFMASTGAYGKLPSLSADGKHVAFVRTPTNEPGIGGPEVFPLGDLLVYDVENNDTTVAFQGSSSYNGTDITGAWGSPSISADGQFVAYIEFQRTYIDITPVWDFKIVVYDLQNPAASKERFLNWTSLSTPVTSISSDGRHVAYRSGQNIYIYDTQTDSITQVSATPDSGVNPNGASYYPSISGDGQVVAYASDASNLVVGDTNGVTDVFVSSNSEIVLTGIEVTQVVQDLNNSVTLIADKPTYVRAHVEGKSGNVNNVTIELEAFKNGVSLGTLKPENIPSGFIDVLWYGPTDTTDKGRGDLGKSFYFDLPKSWRDGGVIKFRINQINHSILCAEQDPNDVVDNCEVSVSFVSGPIPRVRFLALSYYDGATIVPYPVAGDISEIRAQLRTTLPMPYMNWDRAYYQTILALPPSSAKDFNELHLLLSLKKVHDLCLGNCFYIGVLPGSAPSGGYSGWGIPATDVASSYFNYITNVPHEYGHISGRRHTPCKKNNNIPVVSLPNNDYPYLDGKISDYMFGDNAFYGFDALTETVYQPNNTWDLMSYCFPQWPSDYTYEKILASNSIYFGNSGSPYQQAQPSMVISGVVDKNNVSLGELKPIYALDAPQNIPTFGTYSVRFEDSSNEEIISYNFEPEFDGEDVSGSGMFVLVLPEQNNVDHIVLLNDNTVIDTQEASSAAPTVNVISPNGGELLNGTTATIDWSSSDADNDTLTYVVLYSKDNGISWETLVVDWPDTTLQVDPSFMVGTDAGLIRVLASDGFYTAEDQSDTVFSVAKHAPEIEIETLDGAITSGNQTITLEGSGYDMEDGQLPDTSLQWSSDLDGVLGQGESISINAQTLTEGTHTITLAAEDSDLQTGSATITIHVYREFSSLSIESTPLELTAYEGDTKTFEEVLPIWHLGNHSLTWSAAADQSWIVLTQVGTDTPSDLVVSADPSGLSAGTYTGTITITSNAEGITSQTVPVTLDVQPAPPPFGNTFFGGNGNDKTYSMAEDANGNVYVSGTSDGTWGNPLQAYAGGNDGYVVKTDSNGSILWTTFLGGANSDSIKGIATDNAGNIYIAGSSDSTWGSPLRAHTGGTDAFVAKLDPSGALLWNTFLGGSGADQGWGLVVDGNQNVNVIGFSSASWGTPQRPYTDLNDGFVARLNASGTLTWNTFLGGSGDDLGYGIDVDDSGNVYATGYSTANWGTPVSPYNLDVDVLVAKLDASGALVWNTFMGGAGNDQGYDVTANSSGDVFIAGRSTVAWGDPVLAYTVGQDGLAARLDSSGALVWNTFFGGSGTDYGYSIKLDSNGSLNIAGGSNAGWGLPMQAYSADYDAVYVKLNQSGGILANAFQGGSGMDKGYDFSLSNNGNVYLAGYGSSTWGSPLRAYTAGEDGFLARFNASEEPVIVSSVTRVGSSPSDGSSISYAVNFSQPVTGVDVSDFTLTTSGVTGAGIASVSGSGAAYTVNINTGSNNGTIRLDVLDDGTVNSASGPLAGEFTLGQTYTMDRTLPWNTFLGGSGDDRSYGTVRDANGNIYVYASSSVSWGNPLQPHSGDYDAFVAKVDPSGSILWSTFLGGSGADTTQGMTVDSAGNVYVTGLSSAGWGTPVRAYTGDYDGFVAKLDPSGSLVWNTFLGGTGADRGWSIVVDASQNVFVNGNSSSTWGSPVRSYTGINDASVVKLNSSGALVWNTFLGGSGDDFGYGITLDGSNNVYVTGYSTASWGGPVLAYSFDWDTLVAKLDTTGALVWNTFLGGSGSDLGYDIAVDGSNNVFVAGRSTSTWGNPVLIYNAAQDGMAARLNSSSGALAWNTFYGGASTDYGFNIKVDANGDLNIVGSSNAGWGHPVQAYTNDYDAMYVKLDPSGGIKANTFLGGSGLDKGYGIALGESGNIHIAGYGNTTWGSPIRSYTSGNDAFAVKFNLNNAPVIVSSVTRIETSPTSAASVNYAVTFSEAVTGVDVSDFVLTTAGVTGAGINSVSGSGMNYTVALNTGSGNGTIRLDVVDDDSILDAESNPLSGGFALGQSYSVDKVAPSVSSSLRSSTSPAVSTIGFTVTFSEAVSGVNLADFSLTTTGVTGASLVGVTGSGSTYVVTANTGTGSGTIRLNVLDDDTIMDVIGNKLGGTGAGNGGFTTGQTYTVTSLTTNSVAAQDGWVLESAENSNVGGTINSAATTIAIGDDASNKQYRGILHVDTSSLPDTAVVTSVTVKVKQASVTGTSPFTTHGGLLVDIQKPYFGSAVALATEDFQAASGQASTGTFNSTPVSSWYTALLNSAGSPYINLTGTTQLRLYFTSDDNNDAGADYISFSSGNDGTAANRPQIIIQYYIP